MSVRELPLQARYQLAELLDRQDPGGRDWSALASSLGLQDRLLPTEQEEPDALQLSRLDGLLDAWATETGATVRDLHGQLVKLGRTDAVETLLSLALLFQYIN